MAAVQQYHIISNPKSADLSRVLAPGDIDGSTHPQAVAELAELNAPFENGSVMVINLATSDVTRDGRSTTLGDMSVGEEVLSVASHVRGKGIIAANGCCVVEERNRAAVESYIAYTEARGFTNGAAENVVWVRDSNNMVQVLSIIAQLAEREALFYFDAPHAHELAGEHGARVSGNGELHIPLAVEHYAHKSQFRDTIERLRREAGIDAPIGYPHRLVLSSDSPLTEDTHADAVKNLRRAIDYYGSNAPKGSSGDLVLFPQVAEAGGGMGNRVITRTPDGALLFKDYNGRVQGIEAGEDQLDRLLCQLTAIGLDLDITTYLDLAKTAPPTYAFTIMVNEDAITILGPRIQIIDEVTKGFKATTVDINTDLSELAEFENVLLIVQNFAQELHRKGFRGHTDVDVLQFWDSQHKEMRVAFSESNMRRDAGSLALSVILGNEKLTKMLAKGTLSYLLDDHMHVDPQGYGILQIRYGTGVEHTQAIERFLAEDPEIPLASATNPLGFLPLGPALHVDGEIVLSGAVFAESDARKYAIMRRAEDRLSRGLQVLH